VATGQNAPDERRGGRGAPITKLPEGDPRLTRQQFDEVLNLWHPPTVRQVLRLDPSLLTNPSYLASHPKLAEFIALHPEIVHNPTFFVGTPEPEVRYRGPSGPDLEALAFAIAVLGLAGMGLWLIRFFVAHRRWLRITKLQTEAQARILERFSANEDLLAFIQTPAGRRFVDASSSPPEPRILGAPVTRILWSIQAGVVLLFAGIGLEVLGQSSAIESKDLALALLIIGGVLIALGVGFLFSGLASYALSRRFGLFEQVVPEARPDAGSGGPSS
jgi:hypothetical protein